MPVVEIHDGRAGEGVGSAGIGLPLVWADGFVLWPNGLGLDTLSPTGFSFISHAHIAPPPGRILATAATFDLMSRRVPEEDRLAVPFDRPFKIGPLEMTLFPAGHLLGSAQLLVEVDGLRVLYAAGVQTAIPLTAERCRVPQADLVILADHCLPPASLTSPLHVAQAAAQWAIETSSAGFSPVFLVNPLGPAEDLLGVLADHKIRPRVHRSIYDVTVLYERHGVHIEDVRRLDAKPYGWDAVLLPPDLGGSPHWKRLGRTRTALVTGSPPERGEVSAYDDLFVMGTHLDRSGLARYVTATGAKRVALSPIYPASFAQTLARRGIDVFHFLEARQLSLRLEPRRKRSSSDK